MPELLEKTLGSAGALAVFCLIFLWVVDLELIYKIIATGVAGMVLTGIAGHYLLKSRRLAETRKEQLLQHRSANRSQA